MTNSKPEVSVIIPVFDDFRRLEACLDRLRVQKNAPEFEVVVVDNGTPGGPPAPDDKALNLRVIVEKKSGSYAARNLGVRESRADILAFTDADCLPAEDWLERGVGALERLDGHGLVAGRIDLFVRDPENPTLAETWEMREGFPQERYIRDMNFGATANVFTHRDIFDDVGLFEDSLASGGDREFGERVAAAGWPQLYADDVVVRHPARHSFEALLRKTVRTTRGDIHRMANNGELSVSWRVLRSIEAGAYLATPIPGALWRFVKSEGSPEERAKFAAAQTLVRCTKEWELLKLLLSGP